MTKDAVENIIKRYPYINDAIKRKLNRATFYIGNRKCVIDITKEVEKVCEIIDIIYNGEKNRLIKRIIKEIISGQSDTFIINILPLSRNSYYARKQAIVAKIFNGCISWGLVSFEEIINEEIA